MFVRLLRSALLGAAIGLLLAFLLRRTPEGVDLPLAVGAIAFLAVGLSVRRWLLLRRESRGRKSAADSPQDR
jgi:hypothetical protein